MKLRWPSLKYSGELAVTVAALSGWALVTAGVATLLPHQASRALWLSSTGLLLVSLCGWRFVATIVTTGLYVLTRKQDA